MLTQAVESYLAVRRAFGFQLRVAGKLLHSFARFAEVRGEQIIQARTAIEWAGLGSSPPQRALRLSLVIRFAYYLHAEDQQHEIPPQGIFGNQTRSRPVPYIFSPEQIGQIVSVSSCQDSTEPLLSHTYSTLFALLACTGLRVSEAIKLQCQDITTDGLVIRESKFRKTRLVPLHSTAQVKIEHYLILRQRIASSQNDSLFVNMQGKTLSYWAVAWRFQTILKVIGLDGPHAGQRPTLHSLRHTFAVRALEICPRGRDRIARNIVALSTYLGHCNVSATYWYLEATPKLMADIAEACDGLVKGASK